MSRDDCLASDNNLLRTIAAVYLDQTFGYCSEEGDIVPIAWAFKTEAERQRQMAKPSEGF